MSNKIRRAFRTTKLKVSSLSPEAQQELEQLFMVLEARKVDAVTAERKAGRAMAVAQANRALAQDAELEFLEHAAALFEQVASDRVWMVYRTSEGIVLEGLTEKLMRNNLRGQQSMLGAQLSQEAENSGDDSSEGLYESDEDEDNNGASSAE